MDDANNEVRLDRESFKLLIEAITLSTQDRETIAATLTATNDLNQRMTTFMATQEERLQVILEQITAVKTALAELKVNNPDIEDEIAAIEALLAPTPPPAP